MRLPRQQRQHPRLRRQHPQPVARRSPAAARKTTKAHGYVHDAPVSNRLTLDATLVQRDDLRYTPAGIAALRCEGFIARRFRTGTSVALHISRSELTER